MDKFAKYNLTRIGGTLLVVLGITIGTVSCKKYATSNGVWLENSQLARECMQTTAGEDGVLDSKEAATLAKGLGYNGVILSDEKVILDYDFKTPKLLIGYVQNPSFSGSRYRDSMKVTHQTMKNYIRTHKK